MLEPLDFAEYFGFTEKEVRAICKRYELNFDGAKSWYDGYTVGHQHSVYNPFSVMSAAHAHRFRSYWKRTSAAEALMTYIDMDQQNLQADIARLIVGETVEVDIDSFQNDVETFTCKDDVLTLLIHLGYLTYEELTDTYEETSGIYDVAGSLTGYAKIPNEEVRVEFDKALESLGGEIILVGINYDTKTKQHSCRIERIQKQ